MNNSLFPPKGAKRTQKCKFSKEASKSMECLILEEHEEKVTYRSMIERKTVAYLGCFTAVPPPVNIPPPI